MATLEQVRQDATSLSPAEQRELLTALAPGGLPRPPAAQIRPIWYLLIVILGALAFLAGVAAYNLYFSAQKDPGALFLAITTTIVGGLIGLLAPSPVGND
jgi:predicted membrane-bound spermidine synthase